MIGTMQAIGMVLGARLILLIAVMIDAALAFTVTNQFSAGVFAGWTLVVIPLLVFLDVQSRKAPPSPGEQ
jgi:hypothetical protein